MSEIGDRIRELRKDDNIQIEVDEWGTKGKPLIFVVGSLRCHEVNKLQRKHKNFLSEMTSGNPSMEAVVDLIIIKAVDADNKPIFDVSDKPVLLREKVNVLMDVVTKMFSTISNIEELEKN